MRSVRVLGKRLETEVQRIVHLTGRSPFRLSVSRALYRWILEMICRESNVGNLVIGCRPINVVDTSAGSLPLVIDEALSGMTFLIETRYRRVRGEPVSRNND